MARQTLAEDTVSSSFSEDRLTIMRLQEEIVRLRTGTVCALNEMLDLHDLDTSLHASRLAEWAVRVGQHLDMRGTELADLEIGAILHDIGKNGVPLAILKKPGKLDDDERKQVEKHSEYGWAILKVIPGFEKTALFVLHHHERVDGKGYPAGLSGEEIPLASKIITVVDSFDAMTSDRAYRKGLPIDEAVRRLHADSGTQFDRTIVNLFVEIAERDINEVRSAVDL